MVSFFLFVCMAGSTIATSPIINDTDDSILPVTKPIVSDPRRCPPNEVLKSKVACPPDTCDTLELSFPCTADQIPSVVCTCKDGYLRTNSSSTGVCVPADRCPPPITCNKPNERYIGCYAGQCSPKTCDDLGRSIGCPFIIGPCPGGCICNEGYLRDSNGICIKQEKCPPKPCRTNQTWGTTCLCQDSFCPRDDKPLGPCEPLLPCYPGCQCKLNYRLNATRNCILAPECPPVKCTRQNEEWDSCPSACLAENCEDVNHQPTTCNTLISLCSPRCVCAKGYFRNKDGLCIPAAKCPATCTNPNEEYTDCLAGQCKAKTCDELSSPARCPKVKPPCKGGCICVDEFVRDANGVCIEKESCPVTCNKPNESYIDCYVGQCNPKTCDDLDRSIICPDISGPCPGGCICNEGYLRDSNGMCIKEEQCPLNSSNEKTKNYQK